MNAKLLNWERATNELASNFAKKHFGKTAEWYWISGEIGGVMGVGDYFFDLSDIVNFERYKYTSQEVFDYYDYRQEIIYKNDILSKRNQLLIINIKNWKKLTNQKL